MIKEKILRYLIRHDPELCAEVFCEDFIGLIAKRQVDHNSLRFLQKYAGQLEPWLLMMNHHLQREQTMYGKKLQNPGFYEGAMFVIKLLYNKVIHYAPKRNEEPAPILTKVDPLEGVTAFAQGMKKGKNYGQESSAETETVEV